MDKIKHLVLLMMENRSFDHYFGALNLPPENRTDVNGLGPNTISNAPIPMNPYLNATPDEPGVVVWCMDPGGAIPRRGLSTVTSPLDPTRTPAVRFDFPDPPHEWPACRVQWNNGAMDGFVRAYELANRLTVVENAGAVALQGVAPIERITVLPHRVARAVMGYYTGYTLPVYYSLAEQFTICDNWYASFLGSTHPNRVYANAGFCGDVLKTGAGSIFVNKPRPLWDFWEDEGPQKGFTWRFYLPESEVLSTFLIWLGFYQEHDGNRRGFHRFVQDCRAGDLPSVSLVEPPYSFADDHPKHDPRRGQSFVAYVLKALRASPCWKDTALVIYYDEHGGFFDHVPPPQRETAAPVPLDRLGIRVPAMVVSPYARRAAVSHVQYDHRSVLKTIAERWQLRLDVMPDAGWGAINSLWDGCFDFNQEPLPAEEVIIPTVETDWLTRFNAEGQLSPPSDLVQGFTEMAHINNVDAMRRLMEDSPGVG
ncbi:MAG: alkaline phosphatase family protein [Gemmatimonadales bacterium]